MRDTTGAFCFSRRLAALALMAVCTSTALGNEPPVVGDQLNMYAGQALVQSAPGAVRRIAVGDGKMIEVKPVGTRELVFIASKAGDTSIQLWMSNGDQRSINVHITEGNSEQAAEAVRQMIGQSDDIQVNAVGNSVVVTGNNLPAGDVARVDAIKKVYPQVMNMTSANPVQMQPTVMMQVRIMEFDKKAMHNIGIKWDEAINGPSAGLAHEWQTNPYFRVFPGSPSVGSSLPTVAGVAQSAPLPISGTASYAGILTSITSSINLAMQTGNAWELATPQLSAKSGGSADFLVGGQVPVPTSSALGEVTVEYKDYGIKLHLEPVVNAEGDISAKIETELSKIDPSLVIQGYPAFLTRRANTEVNVHEGDTIVISGLVDSNAANTIDKLPGLGQIPVLGELFRSRSFQANKTDLVVFVTPYVIDAQSKKNKDLIKHSDDMRDGFKTETGTDIVD